MGTQICTVCANTIQNTRVYEQHSGSSGNQASKRSGRQPQQKAPEQYSSYRGQAQPAATAEDKVKCIQLCSILVCNLFTKWQGRFLREFFGASRKRAQQRQSILAYSGTCHRLVHWLLGVQPLNPPEDFLSLGKDLFPLKQRQNIICGLIGGVSVTDHALAASLSP